MATDPIEQVEFVPLYAETEETIRERILEPFLAPTDPERRFSVREGGFLYDFATTVTLGLARVYEKLNQVAAVNFLVAAAGDQLDQKGVELNRPRKPAAYAKVTLTIEAPDGTLIPAGTRFSTTTSGSDDDIPVEYAADEDVTVDVTGTAYVPATATVPGAVGNVAANTITQLVDTISGVIYVTNDFRARAGADEEVDDDYRGRLVNALRALGGPGTRDDYEDWSLQVDGVAEALVFPHWAGGGTVKVVAIGPDRTIPLSSTLRLLQDTLDPSVALLATMENDETWSGATFSDVKSEGGSSISISAPASNTVTGELLRDEHLDFITTQDIFSIWINITTAIGNLNKIRFQIVDGSNEVAYREVLAASLSAGENNVSWNVSQMVVPGAFDWANLKKFQIAVTSTGSGLSTVLADSWRVRDADGGVGQGLAPVGAQVTVASAKFLPVSISVIVLPSPGYSISTLEPVLYDRINTYLSERQSSTGFLYLSEIANVIYDTPGVETYYSLEFADTATDLPLTPQDVPVLDTLTVLPIPPI